MFLSIVGSASDVRWAIAVPNFPVMNGNEKKINERFFFIWA